MANTFEQEKSIDKIGLVDVDLPLSLKPNQLYTSYPSPEIPWQTSVSSVSYDSSPSMILEEFGTIIKKEVVVADIDWRSARVHPCLFSRSKNRVSRSRRSIRSRSNSIVRPCKISYVWKNWKRKISNSIVNVLRIVSLKFRIVSVMHLPQSVEEIQIPFFLLIVAVLFFFNCILASIRSSPHAVQLCVCFLLFSNEPRLSSILHCPLSIVGSYTFIVEHSLVQH